MASGGASTPDQSRLRGLVVSLASLDVVVLGMLALALDHSKVVDVPPWSWEAPLGLALARFVTIMLGALLLSPSSVLVVVLAVCVAASGIIAGAVEFAKAPRDEVKDDYHAPLVFSLGIAFALTECLLLALSRSLAAGRAAKLAAAQVAADVEQPLLDKPQRAMVDEEEYVVEEDPRKGQGATFARVMALAYPERYILAVATIALFVSSIASTVIPALFGRLIQTISVSKDEGELNRTMLYLVILMTVSSLFAMIRGALYTLAGERLVARFRVRLFDSVLHNDISFFDASQSGELQSRLSTDTGVLQNAVTVNVSMLLRWLVQLISSLVIIFYISWKLTLIMLGIVPALAIGARLYGFYIQRISKEYQAALAAAAETAEEAFGNVRTVRSFSKESFEVVKYRKRILESYEFGKRRAWAYGIFLGVIGLLAFWAIALVLWLGGRMVIRNTDDLTSSDLTSFLLYTMNLSFALGGLSEIYSTLSSAVGSSQRMFELLDKVPSIGSRKPAGPLPPRKARGGHVVFKGVKFSYPSREGIEVLKGISLECTRGSVNALVGPSGGGKSTIVSLMQRFYDPTAGTIEIDGVPLTEIPPYELHTRMAVVSQEPALFACSIADNIAYGLHRRPTLEEIEQAARKSNAIEFISRFPKGFDTLVGERGVQLSGGQKQRIAIARAMLVDPEILLLDEATSALDAESEHLVQEALNALMKDRTTLCVAHRLSTVRDAHQILVLDGGIVAERGSHEQLIAIPGGLYAALVARQLRA